LVVKNKIPDHVMHEDELILQKSNNKIKLPFRTINVILQFTMLVDLDVLVTNQSI